MKNKNSVLLYKTMFFVFPALLFALLVFGSGGDFLGNLAFLSVAAVMPEEAVGQIFEIDTADSRKEHTQSTDSAEAETAEKKYTEPSQTSQQVQTVDAKLTDTPADVLKYMQDYAAKAANETEDGRISEKNYHASAATDKYGNVYVKNINNTDIDIKAELEKKADLEVKNKTLPYVLIIHSHTTEAYQVLDRDFYAAGYKTRSNSSDTNVARVGTAIAAEIEKAGYAVIHDKTIHDTTYSGAYPNSRKAIQSWLEKYPSIQVVLDVHRDAIQVSGGVKIKPIAEINGKKAAQIMIISGCQEEGNNVENFPDWAQNLTFAVQLQKQMEDMYPGLTRPIYFSPRKYNMDLTHCSLLMEMGSDANTLEEAVYSGRMLGTAVAKMLEKYSV